MDKLFRVEVLAKTPNPQQVIYAAMHQDYSEEFVFEEKGKFPSEEKCGEVAVKRLLAGDKGHWGCTEHCQIVFNCGYFPHSVMQQARTHRVGVSMDVQSGRYSGQRIIDVIEGKRDVEEVFYLRPVGNYSDRQGKKYHYSEQWRNEDLKWCLEAARLYALDIKNGMSEEHARGKIPFDFRQHFVISFTARAMFHFLDLRSKKDAQLEIQQLCDLMFPHVEAWVPAISQWYKIARLGKAKLAP